METDAAVVAALTARLGEAAAAVRLARYLQLLERWSATHNLVRFRSRQELLERHLLEPLALRDQLPARGRLVDVGSGAGLPGVPLLAALPQWSGVLLEPRRKRWSFLRLVIRELGLDAEAVACRYHDYDGSGFDLITARALGGYDALAAWARPRLNSGGRLALWLGDREAERFSSLPGWHVLSSPLAGLDRGRVLLLEPCFT